MTPSNLVPFLGTPTALKLAGTSLRIGVTVRGLA